MKAWMDTAMSWWKLLQAGDPVARKWAFIIAGSVLAVFGLIFLIQFIFSRKSTPADDTAATPAAASAATPPGTNYIAGKRLAGNAHLCNVLNLSPNQQLWQFSASGGKFNLHTEQTCLPSETLPSRYFSKGWSHLVQRKLNIALLPSSAVFLKVLQLPMADFTETLSMVEFQLEKLSPLPVAQIVWAVETLARDGGEQTLLVVIAARNQVETFLGNLEGKGFLADSLEAPLIDQILATKITSDGVWIYPVMDGSVSQWLTAWWQGGALRHLGFITMPEGENRNKVIRDQLTQTVWAGELQGWLTGSPRWHVVGGPEATAIWEPILGDISDHGIEIVPPEAPARVASLTARRAARGENRTNLLPLDFADRYRQQFIDRLWMSFAAATVMVYLAGVLIYFVALEGLKFQYNRAESNAAGLSGSYTNAQALKAQIQVLQDQLNLKNAVLDGWVAAVTNLPPELTLSSLVFSRGRQVTIFGTAPQDQNIKITEYNGAVGRLESGGQRLFNKVTPPSISMRPGNAVITWSFNCELNRAELE